MKKTALVAAAAALTLLAPSSLSLAQNQLPTTTVAAPKQKLTRPPPASRSAPPSQSNIADSNSALPAHPDPAYPNIHVKDWNAPGMLNLHTMNGAQFAAFQAMHPTTVFYGRCYSGQDPDDNIRGWLRRHRPITCEKP